MTDPPADPPDSLPRYGRRAPRSGLVLPVDCRRCGHPIHYDACLVPLPWWRRLVAHRPHCACLQRGG